ncbi:hypothetical protein RO3G_15309 [Rhizopus delemar RA 99-880]|uniref:Uncharacterized protein n=1 Tax=Rhizopus delemar (strain RA 99-880 / ATCC MYA-4621 / FGSC 9543 / NRRL 43880) TaxID=246409 RepID=I1CQ68_RHIO9|nr:hypothetical protein RO3G_15309 [Rhizopus delemar RA 99-880]|eukprot:EIE90598.1 hypothetical protein RO3G_15309 [Rhizopus delemar RA 99-880]
MVDKEVYKLLGGCILKSMIDCRAPLDIKWIINRSHNITDESCVLRDQLTSKCPNSLLSLPQIFHPLAVERLYNNVFSNRF